MFVLMDHYSKYMNNEHVKVILALYRFNGKGGEGYDE